MIEEQVVVTATTEQGAWVEGVQQSACGSCSAKAGCGKHTMSQLGKKVSLWMPYSKGLASKNSEAAFNVGQQIVVGLPEGAILKSTFVLYGAPLFLLILGAILGHYLWGEVGSIIVSMMALLLGFKIANYFSEKNKRNWQPQFLRKCSSSPIEFDRSGIIHSSKS